MNTSTNSTLASWWWPGQWIRMVYGIWGNPLWYWTTIRPALQDWRQACSLFCQAVVGTLLVVLVLSQLILGILAATGIPIAWEKGVVGGAVGMGLVLVGTGLGLLTQAGLRHWGQNQPVFSTKMRPRRSKEALWNKGIVGVVAWGLPISTGLGVAGGSRLFSTIAPNLVTSATLAGIVGLCAGVYAGVVHGQRGVRDDLPVFVFVLIVVGVYQIQEQGIVAGGLETIVVGSSLIISLNLGMRWATRQVPDKLVRQQLANPEEEATLQLKR